MNRFRRVRSVGDVLEIRQVSKQTVKEGQNSYVVRDRLGVRFLRLKF